MLERTLLFMFLIMAFVKENCYATLSDVSRLLGSLSLLTPVDAAFFPIVNTEISNTDGDPAE